MIVITGGAGFIGSNLIAEINGRGETDIVIVDRVVDYETNKKDNIADLRFSDIISPWQFFDWLDGQSKVDAIVHLGAITDTGRTDGELFHVNLVYSTQIFDWCTRHRVPLIYASSAATYGGGEYGYSDNEERLAWLRPLTMYGWSKHSFDLWAMARGKSRNDHPPMCIGLKLFNVYGPREQHKGKMASLISQRLDDVHRGRPVKLFKSYRHMIPDGQQQRDFVFVDDVCSTIAFFLNGRANYEYGIFNVGTGQARTFRDCMVELAHCFGTGLQLEYADMPIELRSSYQYHTQADITKLRRAGYNCPFLSLEEGIRRTVDAYTGSADVAA